MTRHLLVVEDNVQDEFFIVRALKELGIEHRVARDGEEALGQLLTIREPGMPSAVLLDMMLPRVNGLDVLKALRADARTALIPVIVLSSSAQPKDREAAYRAGANAYVQKGNDIETFRRRLTELVVFWTFTNCPPP